MHTTWVRDRKFLWLLTFITIAAIYHSLVGDLEGLNPFARLSFRDKWIPLILIGLLVIVARFRLFVMYFPFVNRPLMLLLLWFFISTTWAADFGFSLNQVICIAGVNLIAIAGVLASWHHERMQEILLPLMTIMLVLSLLVGLALPQIGVHSESDYTLLGSWRGIAYQKNGLGQLGAVALIFWVHAWALRKASFAKALAGVLLCAFLILKSRSSTSLVLSLLASTVLVFKTRPPFSIRDDKGILVLSILLVVVVFVFSFPIFVGSLKWADIASPFSSIFGKDATFSGRTLIWDELSRVIPHYLWGGVGFNSFWGQPISEAAIQNLGWPCPNGHEGYLDVFVETGLIGFTLLFAFFFQHGVALRQLARFDRPQFSLHLAIFIYALLANLTESGWFDPNQFTHVLIMLSSASVSRMLMEQRLRAQAAAGEAEHRAAEFSSISKRSPA